MNLRNSLFWDVDIEEVAPQPKLKAAEFEYFRSIEVL